MSGPDRILTDRDVIGRNERTHMEERDYKKLATICKGIFFVGVVTLITIFVVLYALPKEDYFDREVISLDADKDTPKTRTKTVSADKVANMDSKSEAAKDTAKETPETQQTASDTGTAVTPTVTPKPTKSPAELRDAQKVFSDKYTALIKYITEYYNGEYDVDAIYDAMLHTLVSELNDPYSCYYSPKEYEEISITSDGNYCGIGAAVSQNADTMDVIISQVYRNSPAEKADVHNGDQIVAVDGEGVVGWKLDDVVALMRGPADTHVVLGVLRDGKRLDLDITRGEIELDYVASQMFEGGIGYIVVSSFAGVTYKQFCAALDDLEQQGMTSLIIDLRDNGGGLLDICTDMLDRLLPKDMVLVYTEDKQGNREYTFSNTEVYLDLPMVILSNGYSASASEVFMGALQAYGRAQILGTQSFGKGVVQAVIPITRDGSALRLTAWRYYTPANVCIHGKGITPDVWVDYKSGVDDDGTVVSKYDSQITAAIELLKKAK